VRMSENRVSESPGHRVKKNSAISTALTVSTVSTIATGLTMILSLGWCKLDLLRTCAGACFLKQYRLHDPIR